MSEFEDSLDDETEEIESFDDIRDEVRDLTSEMDFAVAAWHEDGRWTLATLPDPYDIAQIITRLKSQQTNGGSIVLIAIDEEFFILIRVLGSHISLFLSDATAALDYPVAEELMEIADLPIPEEDEESGPVGHLEILADLGLNGMEISALCDDEELFPDEQLEAIAARLGFGEEFSELLDL
jgi:putative tRNA adenosine deaminase-associated protein